MSQVRVGVLGCGAVGSAVVRGLGELGDLAPVVDRIAVRYLGEPRDVGIATASFTSDPWEIVADPSVDIVVEVMGGIVPAAGLIARALESGKPVVTANKAVLGAFGPELRACATHLRTPLLFEAAIAGAVPLVRGLAGLARADEIVRIEGVLNATTTFVLCHMERTGASIEEATAEASRFGWVEEHPARDLDGRDAADKLALLAQCLFDEPVRAGDIDRQGIEALTAGDLGDKDHCWRLVASATPGGHAQVAPMRLRRDHPFALVTAPENAVTITGRRCGAITLRGHGAGGEATACSVIADVLSAQDWLATTVGAGETAVPVPV